MSDNEVAAMPAACSGDDYWLLARRPLNCLCFLTPLLALYEAGVLLLGGVQSDSYRNGADFWMREGLQSVGCQQVWLLPAAVVGGLLTWHLVRKDSWRVSPETWLGMLAESVLFAVLLLLLGQLQNLAFQQWSGQLPLAIHDRDILPRAISFLGAGIYEEVLFRLCLLPACYGAWRILLVPHSPAVVLSVLTTSLLFSAAHYVGPAGDQFSAFSFTFRSLAGLFFAGLFVLRGFGVAAGCHAAYDLLVGVFLS